LLKKNRIRSDDKYNAVVKDRFFLKYTYDGRDYRKLSRSETARFDAMQSIDIKRGGLYFGGRRVRTNVLWVTKVHSAYHWNGGVIVVARTSRSRWHYSGENDIGFIDPKANRCSFTTFFGPYPPMETPYFLVPVTIDTESRCLALDVAFPEKCYTNEMFDVAASLTNVSGRPIMVPDSLFEGIGLRAYGVHRKTPDYLDDREVKSSLLMPFEKREFVIPFDKTMVFTLPNRYSVFFYWDGFLEPGARDVMSRFFCERRVEVTEPAIDTSSGDLLLEVTTPESVPRDGKFDVALSLTNASDRTILVPDSLGDGLGVVRIQEWVRDNKGRLFASTSKRRMQKFKKLGNEVVYKPEQKKYPVLQVPYRGCCSPMLPNEKREAVVSFGAKYFFFLSPGSRVEFHWDGLLDPDDRGSVSRFAAAGRWVDVAEATR
jgi:hypothetical protein